MKIMNILGCALATGLATFATGTAQAGSTVIDGTLYTPLNIQLQGQVTNDKGKIHEVRLNSKDLLNLLGFSSKDQLVTDYDGFGDSADVLVIDKNSVLEDLTIDNIFSVNFDELVQRSDKSGKNDSFSESERGILSLNFDLIQNAPTGIVASGQEIPFGDEFFFEASGVYTWQQSGGSINSNGDQKISTKLSATSINGDGSESTGISTNESVKAISTGGNFDFLIKNGTVVGTGGGTVNND